MRIGDLETLTTFHDKLNPDLWENNRLKPQVRLALFKIAKAFVEFINVDDLELTDITISGSNASFNYNNKSDIDLHLIANSNGPCKVNLKDLFQAKKVIFNDQHDITILGHAVEVYVQGSEDAHISNGVYSVYDDNWVAFPKKITAKPDITNIEHKFEHLEEEIKQALESGDPQTIARLKKRIKDMRQSGLEKNGEFGVENLAFKLLRNTGLIQKLYDAETIETDKELSLGQQGVAEGKLIESAVFLNPTTVIVGQAHGQPLELSPNTLKQIQAIAAKHGAYYEGNGTDRAYTKGQIDRYIGSWDDEVAKTASPNDPKWVYVLFANVDANNRVQRVGIDPKDTIFNRLLATAKDNSFQGIGYTSQALQKFLQMSSEGQYDFVKMSQQPATQENLTRFLKAGEALMWPSNWEQYPNKAGKIAKAATVDVRDQYLATRKAGVYVTGSGHLKAVQNITGKQGVAEGDAETSWSNDTGTITLQDILELTKHIKQINLPINDNLKSKLLHWEGNPEEIERVNQVTVSNQFPILIMVDEQGQIAWILDGNHRLHKAIQSQAKTIPAKLIKPSNLNDKAKKIFNIKEQGVAEGNAFLGALNTARKNNLEYFIVDGKKYKVKKNKKIVKEEELTEKWSKKYKRSIDCSHPKGFSQKAHCAGRKKK